MTIVYRIRPILLCSLCIPLLEPRNVKTEFEHGSFSESKELSTVKYLIKPTESGILLILLIITF